MNAFYCIHRSRSALALAIAALWATPFALAQNGTAVKVDPKVYLRMPEVEAQVTRDADGALTVHWNVAAETVEIFTGTRPDAIDHRNPAGRVDGKQEETIRDLAPSERHYFDLKFTGGPLNGKWLTVAERFLPLQGAANFRDLGGYRTADGRHVRWGLAYRSEGLNKLTASDTSYLTDSLRLHLVCDLRGPGEIKASPDRLPANPRPETVLLPIDSSGGALRKMLPALLKGNATAVNEAMAQGYSDMVDSRGAEVFGPYLARFADAKNLPALVHCTAGKDRTGIASALLLSLLGVPRKTVIADYSLTNQAYDSLLAELKGNKGLAASGIDPEKLAPLLIADPVWMERTLDHILHKYGSVENYLKTVAHLDTETLAKIRANLLQ